MNSAYASRPLGWLIFFALLALLLCSTSVPVQAAITKTTVHDTIYRADGTPASGTLLISWPSFRTAKNEYVAAGSATVQIGSAGAFSVDLAPTEGATPPGVQYRVVLQLTGASPEVQYWLVPAVAQTGITLAHGATAVKPPTPDLQQFILRAGDEMNGPLTLSGTPTDPNHAATKQYVDDAFTTAASRSYVDTAVAAAASKQYVDNAVAAAKISRSVKDYGALCDGTGSHDDTASFQSAINSFAGKGGTLRIPDGCLVTSSLTFPRYDASHRGNLVLQLDGSLFLKATLELPSNISLVGSGTVGAVQFQTGPSGRLEDWAGNLDPVLKLTGGSNFVENISIPWGNATGILIDGSQNNETGALSRLNNVGVFVSGHALTINNYFWVWTRDSRFLNSGATESVRITNSNAGAVGFSGLIYFDDTILSGGGIRLDSQVPAATIGNLYLNRLMRENGIGPILTLDTTNGDIAIVSIDHIADADPVNVQDQVRIVSPAGTGRVYGLHIKGQPPKFGGDTFRAQVFLDGNEDTRFSDINLGSQRFWNYSVRSRVWDIENVGDDTSFSANLFASLSVNQDPATWPNGGGSWTQAVTAPDGSNQAATLSSTVPIADAQIYRVTQPVAVGDWVIAGVFVKGEMPAAPAQPLFSFSAATVPAFDVGGNYFWLTPRGFYESQWRLALNYGKVTNAGEGLADYILSLRTDASHSVSYAFPFVFRIPASSDFSDAEVQRWIRSALRNVVSAVPAGNYALRAHQKLFFGNDTSLSRVANGQLAVNGNALALVSDLASKADLNLFNVHVSAGVAHGASGAVVGTTNIQTIQNKTLDSTNSVAAAAVSGNISGTAAGITGKTTPTGSLVGTTDTQTLQNKTLDATNSVAAAAISGNIGGNAAGFTGSLAGDVSGTQSSTTVAKVNGVAYSTLPSTDTVPVITSANTATYKAVPNCADSGGNHLNYSTASHAFSCGTSSSSTTPALVEWTTGPAVSTTLGITTPAQNTTRLWALFVPVSLNNPTKVSYYVTTADNTANNYDVGIYNSSGTLLCHTGAVAGTTFSSATGAKHLSLVSGCGSMAPGRYYFGVTTNCSSSCAVVGQVYVSTATGAITALSAAIPSSGSATTGGALNNSVGIPADSWSTGQIPMLFLHQ